MPLLFRLKKLGDVFNCIWSNLHALLILVLDGHVNFFAVNLSVFGSFDTETDLFALDLHHADLDVIINGDALS